MNITEPNNLLGPPDGKYAKIGSSQLYGDFSGYLVFTNPDNWTELTTVTTKVYADTDYVIEDISVTPETLRREGTVTNLMVALELPEGITADQISDEPVVIQPGNVKANNQIVSETAGRIILVAMFDKAELMDAIDDFGLVKLQVLGTLTTGLTYSGDITITITRFAGN
jgi:propanediol dehydratase small subunit